MALIEIFKQKFEKMVDNIPASVDSGAGYVIDEVYKILDSLNNTKFPEGLEEAADKYAHSLGYDEEKERLEIVSAKEDFIAGAEWGAECLK